MVKTTIGSPSNLYGSNVLVKATKKQEIVEYLEKLHLNLISLEQDLQKSPKGLHSTAANLISPKILEHTDKEVRVLSACCVVDILRIYAPDAPYKDSDMIRVFNILLQQVRGLETNEAGSLMGKKMVYILNSLATVKSCVVPVIMDQQGIAGAGEVILNMFETLLSIINNDTPQTVYEPAMEILKACIEESDGISSDLLDLLLLPLLPSSKSENLTLYKVSAAVLKMTTEQVLPTLNSVIQNILIGSGLRYYGKLSEIADDIYPLIYELHRISSPLLSGTIPCLCAQLKAEEEEIRIKSVRLLGKLFISDVANYDKEFPRDFRDYLSRTHDASLAIRMEMVDVVSSLLIKGSVESALLEDLLVKRIRDPDEGVRALALNKLLMFAIDNIKSISAHSIDEIAERAKDKKFEIRKAALTGLSKIYFRHISSALQSIDKIKLKDVSTLTEGVSPDIVKKLQVVPGTILKSWGYPDLTSRHLVIKLFQEYILPKLSNREDENPGSKTAKNGDRNLNNCRATALVLVFALADEADKSCLMALLSFKSKVLESISPGIASKLNGNLPSTGSESSQGPDTDSSSSKIKQSLFNLSQIIPILEKKAGFFDRLLASRDKFIWKLLDSCVQPKDSIIEALKHKDDLLKRLDSKSALGEYFDMVYDFASFMHCNGDMFKGLVQCVVSSSSLSFAPLTDAIVCLAKFSPKVGSLCSEEFSTWLDSITNAQADKKSKSKVANTLNLFCSVVINSARYLTETEDKKLFLNRLLEYAGDCEDTSFCIQFGEVLGNIIYFSDTSLIETVVKFVKSLCNKRNLSLASPKLPGSISLLASLIKVPNSVYGNIDYVKSSYSKIRAILDGVKASIMSFVIDEVFTDPAVSATMKSMCLRLITNIVCFEEESLQIDLARKGDENRRSSVNSSLGASAHYETVVNIIFDCLESRGEKFSDVEIANKDDQVSLYESAALAGIAMTKLGRFGYDITAERWHELAWALASGSLELRKTLLQNLVTIIKVHPVHLRFLTYPCMFANESGLQEIALKSLTFAIGRLRKTHEDLTATLVSERDQNAKANLQNLVSENMPESIFPFLLHLLSYHPDFPSAITVEEEEDKSKMKIVVRCLQMLIQALQSTLRTPTSNLPYLFKQLTTINRQFVDRLDADNVGIHFVSRLAEKLLQEQVKTAENVQVYPGEVYLPRDLFVASNVGQGQLQLGYVAAGQEDAPDALNMAEIAIDKVMKLTNKGRNRTGTTTQTTPLMKKSKAHVGTGSSEKAKGRSSFGKDSSADAQQTKSKKPALPVEEPQRKLPSRHAKEGEKKYVEKEVTMKEMQEWNDESEALRTRPAARKRSFPSSAEEDATAKKKRESLVSEDDANDFDLFKSQPIGPNQALSQRSSISSLSASKRRLSSSSSSSAADKSFENRSTHKSGESDWGDDFQELQLPAGDQNAKKKVLQAVSVNTTVETRVPRDTVSKQPIVHKVLEAPKEPVSSTDKKISQGSKVTKVAAQPTRSSTRSKPIRI